MFTRQSPLKRKHDEYHDPDYPQQSLEKEEDDDGKPGCSRHFANKKRKPDEEINARENYLQKVRQVIEREFQNEIVMKQQQMEEIDTRLEKAKRLLDRLRYGIVSAYYKKQEIPLTAADAASLRGANSLYEREDKGPQMPLHPSIKKLIGKRPKDLSEVIRSCPKRTAAQNAVHTIRAKSQVQKREERKLRKLIREQGVVIDHSKQTTNENDVNFMLNAEVQKRLSANQDVATTSIKQEKPFKETTYTSAGKSLNTTRLNNKIKHLIVVGNTSKYIGNELEKDIKSQTQILTHKWLVYVQAKDAKQPIESFVKKIRFNLHHSYRPNDVVDIEAPPFQVSRRGWGEFPIRVQIFFHPEFHQKPIQLVHNIILDQTLSGIQTLGAETLLEIWLRDVKFTNLVNNEIKQIETVKEEPETPTKKPKTNLITRNEELVDDNLLDFLNKIEASPSSISADIEKIQPTVVVTEPFAVKLKTPSPEKCKILGNTQIKSPIKTTQFGETPTMTEKSLTINSIVSTNTIAAAKIPDKASDISSISTILETPLITEKSMVISPTTSSKTLETPKIEEKSLTISSTTSSTVSGSSVPVTTSFAITTQFKPPLFVNSSLTTKPMTTFVRLPSSTTQVRYINSSTSSVSNIPSLRPVASATNAQISATTTTQKPTIILNKDGKILMPAASVASAVRRTILPIVSNTNLNVSALATQSPQFTLAGNAQVVSPTPSSTSLSVAAQNTTVPKQILQKKLVQLVDSTGKVKYIQMLVAASSALSNLPKLGASSVAPKLITMAPSMVKNNTLANTTQITNTVVTPLLKSANKTHLMPAMTMKPNIFKIAPESMQTKPQILTFSTKTVASANTNTLTAVHSSQQQQLKYSNTTTTNTQTTGQISTTLTASRPNNVPLSQANKLQKPNVNNATTVPTKNLVFQKEGKLYIIDPQQMKYKQQQKKQVSLLKPQVSLLKQQQKQKQDTTNISPANTLPQSKQQRLNSISDLQLLQMKRVLFEKQFLRQEFTNIRSAVEFLLRRLKLVVSRESLVAAFPFVCHSQEEFQSLTAFKQRAYEWLRAKNISRVLRSHKDLQRLNNTSKETFWSTKEIATFARQYAYTPPIKSLPKTGKQQQADENSSKDFVDLVKNELKQEQNLQYDTLTGHHKVRKWLEKVWPNLEDYEQQEDQCQIIDIDGIKETEEERMKTKFISAANNTSSQLQQTSSLVTYLTPPPHLENQCQLVSDICKDLSIKLLPEELDANLYHPSTKLVLAQCLHLFIEKLLRQSIALKQETTVTHSSIETICTLMPQDLAKILATNHEFDFLTNNNFGSPTLAECLDPSMKPEKS